MSNNLRGATIFIVLITVLLGLETLIQVLKFHPKYKNSTKTLPAAICDSSYKPVITPSDFTTNITNKYTSLPTGRILTSQEQTTDGVEKTEITISNPLETKEVMGITTIVYRDKVWLDNKLVEDTKDYLAQQKSTGDLWYFGEEVNNYENGKLVDHHGSWMAGVDGALPGIWVKQNPKKGERYLQECFKGTAEDTVEVLSLNETVTTPLGTFDNCLKTRDFTPLDVESQENKYYCPSIAARALVVNTKINEKAELINLKN